MVFWGDLFLYHELNVEKTTLSASFHLVKAGSQTGFLGGGEYQGLVVTVDHLVGDPLEVPGPLADPVRPDGHLDHVVLAHGPQWLGGRVVGGSSVLEQTDRLLAGSQRVHHEAGRENVEIKI